MKRGRGNKKRKQKKIGKRKREEGEEKQSLYLSKCTVRRFWFDRAVQRGEKTVVHSPGRVRIIILPRRVCDMRAGREGRPKSNARDDE